MSKQDKIVNVVGLGFSGRPKPCINIYKHGRLKTKTEMLQIDFDDLLKQCTPMSQDTYKRIYTLIKDVKVDLDKPLSAEDE